jgi:hypothetical protein
MLPDLSDTEKMAHIGRMTVLRKERREIAQKLRDKIVPMLNNIEGSGDSWNLDGITDLVDQINAINDKISELN